MATPGILDFHQSQHTRLRHIELRLKVILEKTHLQPSGEHVHCICEDPLRDPLRDHQELMTDPLCSTLHGPVIIFDVSESPLWVRTPPGKPSFSSHHAAPVGPSHLAAGSALPRYILVIIPSFYKKAVLS